MPKSKPNPVINYQPADSSQISAFGYDAAQRVLGIKFKGSGGSTYHYFEVPPEVLAGLQAAESVGKYFGAHIKGKFLFERQPDVPGGVAYGLTLGQESKYTTNKDGRLCSRATGRAIPDDEPVFVLRAQDRKAHVALMAYCRACDDEAHRDNVLQRLGDFEAFGLQHPDRLKEPDTTTVAPAAALA